jgi:uncharacterized protein DUF2442
MPQPVLCITSVQVIGDYSLRVSFSDGVKKEVNVEPLLWGPVFEPLMDPSYFAQVKLDPICETVVWPNEADLAPEALWELPDLRARPA